MKASEIATLLKEQLSADVVDIKTDVFQPWAEVRAERIREVCMFLREDTRTQFDFLRSIATVDYLAENVIEVVYLLFSYPLRHEFKVKARLPREAPRIATLEAVWPAANWHEREAYDLMGVEFEGHSDLRRILLPDDWIGHPLRKDYKEADEYRGVSTTREYLTGMPQLPTLPPQRPPTQR